MTAMHLVRTPQALLLKCRGINLPEALSGYNYESQVLPARLWSSRLQLRESAALLDSGMVEGGI